MSACMKVAQALELFNDFMMPALRFKVPRVKPRANGMLGQKVLRGRCVDERARLAFRKHARRESTEL